MNPQWNPIKAVSELESNAFEIINRMSRSFQKFPIFLSFFGPNWIASIDYTLAEYFKRCYTLIHNINNIRNNKINNHKSQINDILNSYLQLFSLTDSLNQRLVAAERSTVIEGVRLEKESSSLGSFCKAHFERRGRPAVPSKESLNFVLCAIRLHGSNSSYSDERINCFRHSWEELQKLTDDVEMHIVNCCTPSLKEYTEMKDFRGQGTRGGDPGGGDPGGDKSSVTQTVQKIGEYLLGLVCQLDNFQRSPHWLSLIADGTVKSFVDAVIKMPSHSLTLIDEAQILADAFYLYKVSQAIGGDLEELAALISAFNIYPDKSPDVMTPDKSPDVMTPDPKRLKEFQELSKNLLKS
eukprot:GHVL01021766.1.p2 GENE.GHVL01021766.1~~GHVL01021766.1.p2  ORF type:complete len:353 (+),score=81.88 GHVL01021766.1:1256-2314(+)